MNNICSSTSGHRGRWISLKQMEKHHVVCPLNLFLWIRKGECGGASATCKIWTGERQQDRVSTRVEKSVFFVVIFYRLTLILKTAMFDLTWWKKEKKNCIILVAQELLVERKTLFPLTNADLRWLLLGKHGHVWKFANCANWARRKIKWWGGKYVEGG